MMSARKLATQLLNAVWNDDHNLLVEVLREGADPNWIFNGYPILQHAIYMRNLDTVMTLIEAGAIGLEEALGFALDRGIGEMVFPLAYLGVVPKMEKIDGKYGSYPSRYSPLKTKTVLA